MRGGLSRSRAFSESICAFLGARDVLSPDVLSIAFSPARSYITIDPASLQTSSRFPGKTSAQSTEPFSSARSARRKRAAVLFLALRGVDRRGVRGRHALFEQRRRACRAQPDRPAGGASDFPLWAADGFSAYAGRCRIVCRTIPNKLPLFAKTFPRSLSRLSLFYSFSERNDSGKVCAAGLLSLKFWGDGQ